MAASPVQWQPKWQAMMLAMGSLLIRWSRWSARSFVTCSWAWDWDLGINFPLFTPRCFTLNFNITGNESTAQEKGFRLCDAESTGSTVEAAPTARR